VSDENAKTPTADNAGKDSPDAASGNNKIDIFIDKSAQEFSIKDPSSGRLVTFKANMVEPVEEEDDEEEEEEEPLSPEEFRHALQRLSSMGLTWAPGRVLDVRAKTKEYEGALYSEEFREFQQTYPVLPRELTAVVFHALTGNDAPDFITGNASDLAQKVDAAREFVITPEFRSEFFFKHAIKVPYLESIDWEVVLKTHERNVSGTPGTAYALLLITLHNTNARMGKINEHENFSTAVDLNLVNSLIGTFVEIKTALEESLQITEHLGKFVKQEVKDDGNSNATPQ